MKNISDVNKMGKGTVIKISILWIFAIAFVLIIIMIISMTYGTSGLNLEKIFSYLSAFT